MSSSPTALVTDRRRPGLSIQSILLIMLLLVSITSNVVVGVLGYLNGNESLRTAAIEKVVEVRDSRAREIGRLFDTIENSLLVNARGDSVVDASQAFNAAFHELDDTALTPEEEQQLAAYFHDSFGPALGAALGETVDVAPFIPEGPAAQYLALHYTAASDSFEDALEIEDAGDGSAWSQVHARYHEYFARMTRLLDYQDTLLIDLDGNVVYSAYKGVDLGTNLMHGPYEVTNLAEAYRTAMAGQLLDSVTFTDFQTYRPSLDNPAAWAVSLISDDGAVTGAIAIEMPIDRIASVMTGNGSWSAGGLGASGETYLVGRDQLMRSPSRDLIENPERWAERAASMGMSEATIAQAMITGDTLLLQPVRTEAVDEALLGGIGTTVAPGYLGGQTIAAYAPLDVHDLGWVVIAEVDADEAFAPVTSFTNNLIISSAIIVLVVSLLSLVIAQFLVRPLRRLRVAAERIAAGETDIEVDAGSTFELAAVASAFNDMSRSLRVKAELLEAQQKENDRLLLSLMPEPLARRYREGVRTIAQDHQEVCVMFADIVGFEEYGRSLDSEHALDALNDLVKSFDEAADRLGVERVRSTRQGYLASCGLTVQRVDAPRRIVEFALEMAAIVHRFSAQQGTSLQLRAGIDKGTVTSGLVGRQAVVYDLWGDAVNLAFRLQGEASAPGVFISQAVADRVGDIVALEDAGLVQSDSGTQRVWRIERLEVVEGAPDGVSHG